MIGVDHAWYRKHESESGRWTTADPYTGSMSVSDPQSLNRYSYVENDPILISNESDQLFDRLHLTQAPVGHAAQVLHVDCFDRLDQLAAQTFRHPEQHLLIDEKAVAPVR